MSSPPYQQVLAVDSTNKKGFLTRTHPFYSFFFHADGKTLCKELKSTRCGSFDLNSVACKSPMELPMDRHTDLGRKNMYFVMAMVLTTYVLGVVVFSYWSQFLHTEAGPEDQSVILGRATYLSVFFVAMVILLSLMIYEASTLTVSMMWFEQKKEEMFFYRFLSTRKFGQWLFLFFWLGVVLFTIAILSQRARKFGQVILINVLLCAALLGLQYMYHQTTDNRKKTIFLLVSVVIIGVILGLLYE